jgi:hypothetical protein
MLTLIAIGLLLLVPVLMLLIRLIWPDFIFHWLIALGGAFIAWPLVLLMGLRLPEAVPLYSFEPEALFPSWPMLLIDRLSWPYAVALATLALAVILTDVVRAHEVDWMSWGGTLALASVGMVAVLAGNPLTLLLAWMALDLADLGIMFAQERSSAVRERVVIAFSARSAGSLMLIAAVLVTRAAGENLTFAQISAQAGLILSLAAGLRLGVLPLQMPFLTEVPLQRGLGTMSRLALAAAALTLLARTAVAEERVAFSPYLLGLAALAAVFSATAWMLASDQLSGRTAWLLGLASLAVAAALLGQPAACLAWGLAALFSGGLIFLTSINDRRLTWLTLIGAVGISGLPFTPAWNGVSMYAVRYDPLLVAFILAQSFLMAGYFRHTLRSEERWSGIERWVWLVYPVGLAILPLIHYLVGWWTKPSSSQVPLAGWWVGAAASLLALLWLAWGMRRRREGLGLPTRWLPSLAALFSLAWFYRLIWEAYRFLGRVIGFLSAVFEGEGGVLWALLILALLFLVLTRAGG